MSKRTDAKSLHKNTRGDLVLDLGREYDCDCWYFYGTIGSSDPKKKEIIQTRMAIAHMEYEFARIQNYMKICADPSLPYSPYPLFQMNLKHLFDSSNNSDNADELGGLKRDKETLEQKYTHATDCLHHIHEVYNNEGFNELLISVAQK